MIVDGVGALDADDSVFEAGWVVHFVFYDAVGGAPLVVAGVLVENREI